MLSLAGWSKKSLCPMPYDVVMMGYANEKNIGKDHATDLSVRVLWLEVSNKKFIHIYYELCHVSNILFEAVIAKANSLGLELAAEDLIMSANHTHSAPGGLSEHLYYEVPTPGFLKDLFSHVVDKTVDALMEAHKDLASAEIYFNQNEFPLEWDVAFNRELGAYARNEEIHQNPNELNPQKEIDRSMPQLNIVKENKNAVINWFGVHGTCMSNQITSYHFDNKGYACQYMEEYLGENSLAIFAQASAGDVTPNNIYDQNLLKTRGSFELEDKNAQKVGRYQFDLAKMNWDSKGRKLSTSFQMKQNHLHFPSLKTNQYKLGPACYGVSMLEGTKEGKGIPKVFAYTLRTILRVITLIQSKFASTETRHRLNEIKMTHTQKDIIVNATDKSLFGFPIKSKIHFIGFVDPLMKKFDRLLNEAPYKDQKAWINESSYVSLTVWDNLALIALPFEVTSMSSKRIKEFIQNKNPHIENVIINGYSYNYLGYLTTPEEYDYQGYEGGHTVFGKWTLPVVLSQINAQLQELH